MSLQSLMCDTIESYCKSTMPTLMGGSSDVYMYEKDIPCHIQQGGSSQNSSMKARGLTNSYTIYFDACPDLSDGSIIRIKRWAKQGVEWDGTVVSGMKWLRTLEVVGVRAVRGRGMCMWEVSATEITTARRFIYPVALKMFDDNCLMMGDDGSLIAYESTN